MSDTFKLGFSGSRKWSEWLDYQLIDDAIMHIIKIARQHYTTVEIHVGDADGIDSWVLHKAVAQKLQVYCYGAYSRLRVPENFLSEYVDFYIHPIILDAKDYLERDRRLVDNVDMIYGLWNGRSRGTKYTLDYAKR